MSSASRMPLFKVTVLGDGGVGKTALTIQLCLNHFVETYDPTIEDSYRKQIHLGNTPCLLEILDTAGQEEYTALRDQWIRDGQGFLLIYSIASMATFQGLRKVVEQLIRVKQSNIEEICVMLVGNKADMTLDREVSVAEAEALARTLGCGYIETSAKTGMHVEDAFYRLVAQMTQYRGDVPDYQATKNDTLGSLAHRDSDLGGQDSTRHRRRCDIM